MEYRTRFAPSPTGKVHIGNIRTAIFNWLVARHTGGTFLLRIEDTDLERSTKEAIDAMLDCMNWLGLDYDEEPMYQTAQCPKHLAAAQKFLQLGCAYKADPNEEKSPVYFRIPMDCDSFPFVRSFGTVEVNVAPGTEFKVDRSGLTFKVLNNKGNVVETQACLAGYKDLKVFNAAGEVIFAFNAENLPSIFDGSQIFVTSDAAKISYVKREVQYNDLIKGKMAKPLDSMRDFVIIRSDGSPVFHLANVWDDIDQKVTLIIRGDDHVENTFRHHFIFQMLGYPVPVYAHLPMIVNKQGKPYSKRDGDAFVGDFRDKGILPEALFNYLTLIGWAPGDNREKMTRQELVEAFNIEHAQRSCAQFDNTKLANMNGLYIAELPDEKFIDLAWNFSKRYPWHDGADKALFDEVAKLFKTRTKLLTDIEGWKYFFEDVKEYDAKGVRKFLGKDELRDGLLKLADLLDSADFKTPAEVEMAIRGLETSLGLSEFALNQPLRVASTGTAVGAGMYETVMLIGLKKTALRIREALEKNPAEAAQ